ncbi:AsmA family protein [Haliea sp. E1-2-M8]|uniref:AsmA family protein n=1 Tax=Haliea sp. E1-2-M8 TaxID=3064706 RepID=UPI0027286EAD|nr:AsmA family protein [Haliea sp. E1-2-M8]MDO8863459.1 AsmA family protein [Haliea sp. E1-2-M8]
MAILKIVLAAVAGVIAVTLGLAAVALVVVVLAVESTWFSGQLQTRLEEKWNREIDWSGGIEVDWSLAPTVTLEQPTIENALWAEKPHIAQARSISARIDLPQLLQRKLVVEKLVLEKPQVHLRRSPDKGTNWQAWISDDEEPSLFQTRFEEIEINDGKLTYADTAENTNIATEVDTGRGQRLRLDGEGSLKGKRLAFGFTGDPPREMTEELVANRSQTETYDLQGKLDWGEHQLTLNGHSGSLSTLQSLEFQFSLKGPDASTLSRFFGYETRDAAYRIEGTLRRRDTNWQLENIDGQLADSGFEGSLSWLDKSEKPPTLILTLDMETLNLDKTLPMLVPSSQGDEAAEKDRKDAREEGKRWNSLIKELTAKLRDFNFDLDLQAQRVTLAGRELDNAILRATLASGQLDIENFSAELGEGSFTVTGTADGSRPLPRANLAVALQALDMGRALPAFEAAGLGYLEGRLATRLENNALLLEESSLRYWHEEKKTDIEVDFAGRRTRSGAAGVRLDASGTLRDHLFNLEVSGGPLLDLDDPRKPYPLSVNSTFGETEIRASGTVTQPLIVKAVDLQLHVEGPDPAQLWYISPLPLPHLPPYEIDASFERDGALWHLRDIDGTVGNSDLAGKVRWRAPPGERPEVWADLTSSMLDLDDLLPVVGLAPATGSGEVTSPALEALARQQAASEEVLPEAELMRKRLKAVNAHLDFNALEMRAKKVPFEEVVVKLDLEDGVLQVYPLALRFAEGKITLNGDINANPDPAQGSAKLEIAHVDLHEFARHFDVADDTRGILGGDGQATFAGNSVQQALASLDGSLDVLMSGGQIDALLVEAVGLDLGEVLFSLGQEKPDPVEILCLYSKIWASDGQANIKALTMATSDSNIVGEGNVNFASETYELVLEARPKDFSVLSSSSPVRVYGDFDSYNLDVVSAELVARGALTLLAAVIFPPAALLPLVEPGTASGQAGCQQLVSSSEGDAPASLDTAGSEKVEQAH